MKVKTLSNKTKIKGLFKNKERIYAIKEIIDSEERN